MRDNKLIQFYLTNLCNSKCKTCTIWKNKDRLELDPVKVIDIIKQYPDADYVFGGGEFTLYSHRHALLNWCDINHVNYTILSNAVSIDRLRDILDHHNVKNLTISCDGIDHDSVRGCQGNLENIKTILSEYRDKIDNIKISYTYSSFNAEQHEDSMKMFKDLGVNKIYFCLAQNMDLLNSDESVVATDLGKLETSLDMLYDKDRRFIESLFAGNKCKCDSTSSVFTVCTNGDVVRCQSYLSNSVLGNIYKKPFNQIINSSVLIACPYDNECNLVCQRRYDL